MNERTTLPCLSGPRSGLMDLGNLDFLAGNVDIETSEPCGQANKYEHWKNYNISYLGEAALQKRSVSLSTLFATVALRTAVDMDRNPSIKSSFENE